jgi:hypothetical protein
MVVQDTGATGLVMLPLAFVDVAVGVVHNSFSLFRELFYVALIALTIGVDIDSFLIETIVFPSPEVDGAIAVFEHAKSTSLVIIRDFSDVLRFVFEYNFVDIFGGENVEKLLD